MRVTFLRIELSIHIVKKFMAILCAIVLVPGDMNLQAQSSPGGSPPAGEQAARIPAEQLDSLVAPIALYPDPMLSQTLVASTYPLEIIQLQQWLEKNKGLKDKALADAVKKQDWDPSIQAMAVLPEVLPSPECLGPSPAFSRRPLEPCLSGPCFSPTIAVAGLFQEDRWKPPASDSTWGRGRARLEPPGNPAVRPGS